MLGIKGLVIQERMNGWIRWNHSDRPLAMSFHIRAFSPKILRFGGERRLEGSLHIAGYTPVSVRGHLRLALTGPHYCLHAEIPGLGLVRLVGHKTYQLKQFRKSLVTCPMSLYQGNQIIGQAKVRYEEPIYQFPFKSVRLVLG